MKCLVIISWLYSMFMPTDENESLQGMLWTTIGKVQTLELSRGLSFTLIRDNSASKFEGKTA
jgi:hypothetical protein